MEGPPPEAREPVVPRVVTCPSCGVSVQVGYPRCPRCHGAVPMPPRSKRATARDTMTGGTTAAPEDAPRIGWFVAAGIVLVAGAVGIWLATRDAGAGSATEEEAAEEDDEVADDDEADDEGAGTPGIGDEPRPDEGGESAAVALRELEAALRAERLWGRVGDRDGVVVIESALCEDRAMWPTIADQAGGLREAGLTAVRCVAPHGGVVFERGL